MKKVILLISTALILIIGYVTYHKTVKNIPNDGEKTELLKLKNILDYRYLEVLVVGGDALTENLHGACYNTTTYNGQTIQNKNSAPQKLVDQLNTEEIAKELGGFNSFINGPRVWCLDWINVQAGKVRDFNGLKARWVASLNLKHANTFSHGKPAYLISSIKRNNSFGINKGTTVFLLDDDKGNTWVMKSYSLKFDSAMTREKVPAMMAKLNLPKGWNYRVVKLEKDLVLKPESGVAMIVSDDKDNVYDRTGIGYSNYRP